MFLKKHKVLIFVFSEEKHIKGSSLKTRPFYRNNTNNPIINTFLEKKTIFIERHTLWLQINTF